jgi:hypothetical protein
MPDLGRKSGYRLLAAHALVVVGRTGLGQEDGEIAEHGCESSRLVSVWPDARAAIQVVPSY